jgi:translation elongation factor EF-Tu-like GTPase
VEVELESEVPIESGWRIILRAEGRSIAAGLVE